MNSKLMNQISDEYLAQVTGGVYTYSESEIAAHKGMAVDKYAAERYIGCYFLIPVGNGRYCKGQLLQAYEDPTTIMWGLITIKTIRTLVFFINGRLEEFENPNPVYLYV